MSIDTVRPEPARIDPETETVNELVLRVPAALPLLAEQGIDTCCGGGLSVAEACRRHGVDVEELLARLEDGSA